MRDKRAKTLEEAWAGRVASWDGQVAESPAFAALREKILELAVPAPDDDAADLGAGTGYLTIAVAERVGSVAAVDLVPGMLAVALEEAQARGLDNVTSLVEDLGVVDFPPESLDLVVSSYALHHLTDANKLALVQRCNRWLRPEGRLVIGDMMFGRGTSARDRRIFLDKVRRLARKGPAGLWRILKNAARFGLRRGTDLPVPPEFWTKALKEAGFVDVVYASVVSEAGVVSGRVPRR